MGNGAGLVSHVVVAVSAWRLCISLAPFLVSCHDLLRQQQVECIGAVHCIDIIRKTNKEQQHQQQWKKKKELKKKKARPCAPLSSPSSCTLGSFCVSRICTANDGPWLFLSLSLSRSPFVSLHIRHIATTTKKNMKRNGGKGWWNRDALCGHQLQFIDFFQSNLLILFGFLFFFF